MAYVSIIRRSLRALLKITRTYRLCVILYCSLQVAYYYWSQRFGKTGIPVVIIDHNFVQDIDVLRANAGASGINLIRIPYEPIYALATLYFGADIRDSSYQVQAMRKPREAYNKLLRTLFSIWYPERKIRGFMSPSDSFFWIREIVTLLRERGIPCIVVDKEGTISPHSMEHHSRQVSERYPFMSDAIIVWSERQREFWKRTGVSERKIFVAGQPRSDFFFNRAFWKRREHFLSKFQRLVLFFSFETDAYAPDPGVHIWGGLRRDIHDTLIASAKRYPETLFVIKTHPQQLDRVEVETEFSAAGLKNIEVSSGPEISRHLIVHADLVIGFQTTALIEAMLAGKRVIYTEWSDAVEENLHNLIPFHQAEGIDFAHSPQEFEKLLAEILINEDFGVSPEAMAARKPFVDVFIPNADGQVSQRVMNRVEELINCSMPGK